MTLSTLFDLSLAYYYGFRGSLISHAISSSLSGIMGTIFVILAIGTVIGTLYLTGTVASIICYGVALISARFYYITIFILESISSWGDVIDIGMRSTKIVSVENSMVVIPNSQIGKNQIVNFSYPDPSYFDTVNVLVGYDNDVEQVEQLPVRIVAGTTDQKRSKR